MKSVVAKKGKTLYTDLFSPQRTTQTVIHGWCPIYVLVWLNVCAFSFQQSTIMPKILCLINMSKCRKRLKCPCVGRELNPHIRNVDSEKYLFLDRM